MQQFNVMSALIHCDIESTRFETLINDGILIPFALHTTNDFLCRKFPKCVIFGPQFIIIVQWTIYTNMIRHLYSKSKLCFELKFIYFLYFRNIPFHLKWKVTFFNTVKWLLGNKCTINYKTYQIYQNFFQSK